MLSRLFQWIGLLLSLALLLPVGLRAQGGATGAITGTVVDQNGGVIPNAKVEVYDTATGVKVREVTTSDVGTFTIPLLKPSTYRLEVTASGFAKFVAPNVVVRVTETTMVEAKMQIGQVTETVTVTGAAAPVNLTSATTGETIGATTVSTLPLASRNFLTLLSLAAGANTELYRASDLGRGSVTLNVNGERPVNNNYQLEGINTNDFNLPTFDNVPLPNPDTVQEFKTQTSLYDASTGRNAGGNIQVNLRTGTDKYHGDVYEFFRNNVLNSNDWFLNSQGQKRPVLRQNQFGASFGGPAPIGKDFFFFLNYQGTRAASGASAGTLIGTTLPILPQDRSQASLISTFFPGGGITSLDPAALAFLNLPASKCSGFNDGTHCIPSLPGTAGFTGGTLNTGTISRSALGTFQDDQFVVTVDKNLTARDKLSGRVFFSDNSTLRPFGGAATLPFPQNVPGSNRFVKASWTRTIGDNIVNDAHFGFNRFTFALVPTDPIALSDIGATRPNQAEFPAIYQAIIEGPGSFSLGNGVNDDRGGAFNTFVGGDDFSITRSKHFIRFGAEADRYQLNRFNHFASRGSVTFASFQDFLLGNVLTTQGQSGFSAFHFRATDAAAYVQDDWKVATRLTVNLGLRWEGMSTAHELNNLLSNFRGLQDGTSGIISIVHPAGTPVVGTPGVSNCTLVRCMDRKDFAPRVGIAWDVFGDQKTVIRSGFGIYYDRTSNQSLLQTAGGLPFDLAISAAPGSVTPENPFPTMLPDSAFPLSTDEVIPKLIAFDATTGAPIFQSVDGNALGGFFFFPVRNFHAPYSEQWNLNLQRALLKGWTLEVGYVGAHGVDLIGTGAPLNPGQICTIAKPCFIPPSIGSSVTVPAGTPFVMQNPDGSILITGNTAANIDARVPVQFLGLANSRGFFQSQMGNSIYHALQATLSHRFAGGLYFQGAYTFSKSIDNSSGSSFQDELNGLFGWGDLLNQKRQRGPSDFDRTHRLVVSYNYELPFANWAGVSDHGLGKLLHGWGINGVTTFQSGTPFMVDDSQALSVEDAQGINSTNFATLMPGLTLTDALTHGSVQSRINNFINLNAFMVGGFCVDSQNVIVQPVISSLSPSCATGLAAIGNVGRNAFRGPFQQNWDMSFTKRTAITEGTSVDFRAEFFNIFNHPVFQSPQAAGGSFGNYGIVNVAGGTSAITGTITAPRIIQFALKFNF